MSNYSTIFYKDLKGFANTITIPTIQNLDIPDSTTIPSKPTITGEYRNQYVSRCALRVSFEAWLENGSFGEETLNIAKTVDQLEYLKNNRILFNLTTSHEAEESRFLANLTVENISYNRNASHKGRLCAVINCTEQRLVDLTWKQASAIEIFGHDIFTDAAVSDTNVNMDFTVGVTDTDFDLSKDSVSAAITKLGDISGYSDMPVNRRVRAAIQGKVALDKESYYYKLTEPIDMATGTRTYTCSCAFNSRYGLGSDEDAYTVDLGKFIIDVTKGDASIVENFPLTLGYGQAHPNTSMSEIVRNSQTRSSDAIKNKQPVSAYPYDFADTYPDFNVNKSFEYSEGLENLAEFLLIAQNNNNFTEDMNAASSGGIIVKNGYVWSYKIANRYSFDVGYGSFRKPLKPDGALKIDTFDLTSANGFKVVVSNSKAQTLWDQLYSSSYKVSVVTMTLGAMVQVYLFSPTLFNKSKIDSKV